MDKELDLYYQTTLTKKYKPQKWIGYLFQENAGFEEMYNRINALNPNLVIDAGCGRNKHKNHIKNLIGFDASPYPEVDLHCAILDAPFDPNSADAVLALGSVQYISRAYVVENMKQIISWVKPGGLIEMRVMLDDDKSKEYNKVYDREALRFPWDNALIEEITNDQCLEFVTLPWSYSATAPEEGLEKEIQLMTGYMPPERMERRKEKFRAMQELSRLAWTWRKSNE